MDLYILLKSSVRYIKWGKKVEQNVESSSICVCVCVSECVCQWCTYPPYALKDTEVSNSGRYWGGRLGD